jgi:hypothetical protein
VSFFSGMIAIIVAQAKVMSYCDADTLKMILSFSSIDIRMSSSFDHSFILWAESVNGSSKSSSHDYLASSSCDNRRDLF